MPEKGAQWPYRGFLVMETEASAWRESYQPSCPRELAVCLRDVSDYLVNLGIPNQERLAHCVWVLRAFERHLVHMHRFRLAYDIAWVIREARVSGEMDTVYQRLLLKALQVSETPASNTGVKS